MILIKSISERIDHYFRGMEYLPNADNFLIYCIHHIILNYISRQKRVAEVDCVQEKYNSDET